MIKINQPFRLEQTLNEIKLSHPNIGDTPNVSDDAFIKLLRKIVAMNETELKRYTYTLLPTDVIKLCKYAPGNIYNLKLDNIFKIIRVRLNTDCLKALYYSLQNKFDNRKFNKFFGSILDNVDIRKQFYSISSINTNIFLKILNGKWPHIKLGQILCQDVVFSEHIQDKLQSFNIKASSAISKSCTDMFYFFCCKDAYIKTDKANLNEILRKNNSLDMLRLFISSFFKKLSMNDLIKYFNIIQHTQSYIGKYNSDRYNDFFKLLKPEIERKYHSWINLYELYSNLDNERIDFWKMYEFVDITRYKQSSSLVMEFEYYYAIEFIGSEGGPVYFFTKKDYENHIQSKMAYSNAELRQGLYHEYWCNYFGRYEHRFFWQSTVSAIIQIYKITQKAQY